MPNTNVGSGYAQGTWGGGSEVYETSSGGSFGSGAPAPSFSAPTYAYVPRTLDVLVVEGILMANGDSAATGIQSGEYVDNRGTGTDWQNAQAVFESDDVYATVELAADATSSELFIQGFGFDIPADAELLGIEVIVERSLVRGAVASDLVAVGSCVFETPGYFDDSKWIGDGYSWSSGDSWWSANLLFVGSTISLTATGGWNTPAFRPTSVDITATHTTNYGYGLTYTIFYDSGATDHLYKYIAQGGTEVVNIPLVDYADENDFIVSLQVGSFSGEEGSSEHRILNIEFTL